MKPFDPYCNRAPDEIDEYLQYAREAGMTPDDYVRAEEGTYNPISGHFACTDCYIRLGMPTAPSGWKAP